MNRILVVLPNWYGETLFATPFLRALRRQRPQAFIATLGRPACREILLHHPHLDELLDLREDGVHRGLLGWWRLITALRARRFDTAFILRRSISRTLALVLAGIPSRVGMNNLKSGWLLTHRAEPVPGAAHKSETYWPLLSATGLSPMPGPYEYVVSEAEREAAGQWLSAQKVLDEHRLVILHPGANWPHKRWAPEHFAALGDRLAAEHHLQIALTGGREDVPLAESIAKRVRHPTVLLAGQTTLRQLAALLERARLVVSNDTGVLHLAAALRRPVVALYGPTAPALTGPLGDPARTVVLHHPDSCPRIPCYDPDHPPHAGMNAISVEEAYAACVRLLEAPS